MSYLNVLKGDAMMSLSQVNTVRPIDSNETGVTRGSLMRINANDKFQRTADDQASHGAANSPGPIIYLALHEQDDTDVKMAGAMSALDVKQDMVIETDMYQDTASYNVGDYLMAGDDGKWMPATDDATVIGQVVKTPYKVFDNKAVLQNYDFTGAPVDVLRIRTMYIPNLSIA